MKCSVCQEETELLQMVIWKGEKRFFPRCKKHNGIINMKLKQGKYQGKEFEHYIEIEEEI
jgi:hypothetical protein